VGSTVVRSIQSPWVGQSVNRAHAFAAGAFTSTETTTSATGA